LAAPHIENPPIADPIEDGAVSRFVQGQERVRGDTLLWPLPRQSFLGRRVSL
jgi:hypothetical protein